MRTYQLATFKDSEEVLRSAARNFIKRAASVTPPSTGKLDSSSKQRGEAAIKGDLNSIFVGLSPSLFSKFNALRQHGIGQMKTRDGKIIVEPTDVAVPSIKGWHYANRRRNGRVRGGRRAVANIRAVVLAARKKAYTVNVLKKVGMLAAGWNASAEKLGTRLPAWIVRHGAGGGKCAVTVTRSKVHIRMENIVGFAAKVAGLKRRIQWALDVQANALDRAVESIMRKAGRSAGFRR